MWFLDKLNAPLLPSGGFSSKTEAFVRKLPIILETAMYRVLASGKAKFSEKSPK